MDREMLLAGLEDYPWRDRLHCLTRVDSTNRFLKDLAQQGAGEGTAVLADCQTAGRGRLGRSFDSRPGGLYLSMLLRPKVPVQCLTMLTPMAGAAVLDALEQCTGIRAQVKWVNDIVYGGKKLCGILCELIETQSAEPTVILGVGVNVGQLAFPEPISEIATSLALEGFTVPIPVLASGLLCRLAPLSRDLERGRTAVWMERYEKRCQTVGRDILVLGGDTPLPAHADGIGPGGELLVTWHDGSRGSICSGEVSIRTPEGYC